MLSYNIPDYTKYFEHKNLDKIHGQPTIENIVKLLKHSKRNAQSVPTTLGGRTTRLPCFLFYTRGIFNDTYGDSIYSSYRSRSIYPKPKWRDGNKSGTRSTSYCSRYRNPASSAWPTEKRVQWGTSGRACSTQTNYCGHRWRILTTASWSGIWYYTILDPWHIFPLKKTYGRLSPGQLKEKELLIDNFVYDPIS